jgi:hypothetical protein
MVLFSISPVCIAMLGRIIAICNDPGKDKDEKSQLLCAYIKSTSDNDQLTLVDCILRLCDYATAVNLLTKRLIDLECMMDVLEAILSWCNTAHTTTEEELVIRCTSHYTRRIEDILANKSLYYINRILHRFHGLLLVDLNWMDKMLRRYNFSVPSLKLCNDHHPLMWRHIINGRYVNTMIHTHQIWEALEAGMPLPIDHYFKSSYKPIEHTLRLFHKAGSKRPDNILSELTPLQLMLCVELWNIPLSALSHLIDCNSPHMFELIRMGIPPRKVTPQIKQIYLRLNMDELNKLEQTWRIPRDIIGMVIEYCKPEPRRWEERS